MSKNIKDRAHIVFLDRDGTINIDRGYVTDPNDLALISGAAGAIAALKQEGFAVVVVTNQSAIGRGFASEQDVITTNRALQVLLSNENSAAELDCILYAPDHPDTPSDRRKPGIGMLRELPQSLLHFDSVNSWIIGDKLSDMEFGTNAGIPHAHCILVGRKEDNRLHHPFPYRKSIVEAAALILEK